MIVSLFPVNAIWVNSYQLALLNQSLPTSAAALPWL